MTQLEVKGWSDFQHYRNRGPVWIKLYLNLLDNYEFGQLSDGERGQLVSMWLLAAKSNGKLPNDAKWIASRINCTSKLRLHRFIDTGFLLVAEVEKVASKTGAEPEQHSSLEKRREREERETDTTTTEREAFVALVPERFRPDVVAAFRATHRPEALFRSLDFIVKGGEAEVFDHAQIGQAIQEIAIAGRPLTINTVRTYCRNIGGRAVPRATPPRIDTADQARQWAKDAEKAA